MTFQVERWPQIEEEIKPLLVLNWRETGLDHETIHLDPNFEIYRARDAAGELHVVTARHGNQLAGYFFNFIAPHPHYKSTLFAFQDVYFLKEEHRGPNGIRLFLATEKYLRERGVREMIANTKISHNKGAMFDKLGWRLTAMTYSKLIGESS